MNLENSWKLRWRCKTHHVLTLATKLLFRSDFSLSQNEENVGVRSSLAKCCSTHL